MVLYVNSPTTLCWIPRLRGTILPHQYSQHCHQWQQQQQRDKDGQAKSQAYFYHSRETGESGLVEHRYGGPPARDAALVIQRAYRRYSMVKEFHRIKTERRLSRRINNNVPGTLTTGVNGCELCADLHESEHHHHHGHPGDGCLDDDEDLSVHSGELSRSPVPELGDIEVVDLGLAHPHSQHQGQQPQLYDPRSYYGRGGQGGGHLPLRTGSSPVMMNMVPNGNVGMTLPPPPSRHHPHHHPMMGQVRQSSTPSPYQNSNGGSEGLHTCSSGSSLHYCPQPSLGHQQYQGMMMRGQSQGQETGARGAPVSSRHIPTQQQPGSMTAHMQLQYQLSQQHQQHPYYHHPNRCSQPPPPGHLMKQSSLGQNQFSQSSSLGNKSSSGGNLRPQGQGSPLSPANLVGNGHLMGNNGVVLAPTTQTPKQNSMSEAESEILRKRLYRVGLNLFNKKPEVGISYLVKKKFLEGSPPAVSRFLISRKGLSKQMIGEYLTNLQSPFSMACLEHFANEIDLSKMPIDLALRRFQTYLRMPGEAQKIERMMESFSRRYGACNPEVTSQFRNGADTVFVLAFAIIMLNTDLHTPHLKADRRMKMEDFIKNLRGIDDGGDVPRDILVEIYERIKQTEFRTGSDHVTQVMKVQQTIVGKKPNLALPHRRLVCYCRLYEVADVNKREKTTSHQREVFLFNDTLVLTKIFHKKRNSVTYSFRQSYPLAGIHLVLFNNQYYEFGLSLRRGDVVLLNLNARNEHDRAKFAEDLREAIAESDEMTRIESFSKENRDSGVDVGKMKRFSNSMLDLNDQCKPARRGSCGSLDSGMSISFHSDETGHGPHQQQQPPQNQTNNHHLTPNLSGGPPPNSTGVNNINQSVPYHAQQRSSSSNSSLSTTHSK